VYFKDWYCTDAAKAPSRADPDAGRPDQGRVEQWRQALSARDFVADESINLQEYFVYFKD
jgi:hypothetical protein